VLPRAMLEAIAELARRRDLWLISDEVYEDYVYRGEHVSIGALAPERTISVFSFSKAYGMAGNRVGSLAGPRDIVAEIHKVQVHSSYHAPTASQLAALAALRGGAGWVAEARASYRAAGDDAAAALGLAAPEGSRFLFVRPWYCGPSPPRSPRASMRAPCPASSRTASRRACWWRRAPRAAPPTAAGSVSATAPSRPPTPRTRSAAS
jgi:hypothetical protein